MVTIAIDAMGGDNAPKAEVEGAVEAARTLGIRVILVGRQDVIRQELQRLGAPARFMVTPGAGSASTAVAEPIAAPAGSVQEAALAHPLVKRAQEIFKAEVRSVVDLRQK